MMSDSGSSEELKIWKQKMYTLSTSKNTELCLKWPSGLQFCERCSCSWRTNYQKRWKNSHLWVINFQNFFSKIQKIYNMLLKSIKEAQTTNAFKTLLKQWIWKNIDWYNILGYYYIWQSKYLSFCILFLFSYAEYPSLSPFVLLDE